MVSTFASGFSDPAGLAFDRRQPLRRQHGNNTVSEVTPAGVVVSTFASGFNGPGGLAFDAAGNLYVANLGNNTVSEVTPAGVVSTFASGFDDPDGLAFDSAGNLYVANNGDNTVSKVTPAGGGQHLRLRVQRPRRPGLRRRRQPVRRQQGNGTVSEVTPAGVVSTFASGFSDPDGLAFDAGNLYVANVGNNTVSEVSRHLDGAVHARRHRGLGRGLQRRHDQSADVRDRADHAGHHRHAPGRPRPQPDAELHAGHAHGGAVLGSPSVNTLTITEPAAGTSTPTPTPTSVAPLFLGEQRVFSGKGKHKKLTGFEFLFHGPLNAGIAQSTGNFHVTQKHGKKAKVLRVKSALQSQRLQHHHVGCRLHSRQRGSSHHHGVGRSRRGGQFPRSSPACKRGIRGFHTSRGNQLHKTRMEVFFVDISISSPCVLLESCPPDPNLVHLVAHDQAAIGRKGVESDPICERDRGQLLECRDIPKLDLGPAHGGDQGLTIRRPRKSQMLSRGPARYPTSSPVAAFQSPVRMFVLSSIANSLPSGEKPYRRKSKKRSSCPGYGALMTARTTWE